MTVIRLIICLLVGSLLLVPCEAQRSKSKGTKIASSHFRKGNGKRKSTHVRSYTRSRTNTRRR